MTNTAHNVRSTWRLLSVAFVIALCGAALVGRLAYLQIVRHEEYQEEARGEHIAERQIQAQRGSILDRAGNPLAMSVQTFDVLVDRLVIEDTERAPRVAERLAKILNRPPGEILRAMDEISGGVAVVARDLPYETGKALIDEPISGVIISPTSKRVHPERGLASSVIGFMGRDNEGLSGAELDFDELLKGEDGVLHYERDSLGQPIAHGLRWNDPPKRGGDVVLTIDRTIQRMIEKELDDAIKATKATGGTIIVQEPSTGAILGMVSRPSFDLTQLDLNDPSQADLYRNRAVTDQYEPGSVFKLVTMAAAIDSGKVTPNTTYQDTGSITVGERVFANWDFSANGTTTMTRALVRSLNTGTVWLAARILGPEAFYRYVKAFGFGKTSGSNLTGESPGFYRLPTDDDWYDADLASNSFGQGISTTPLQIINMVSVIANGGHLMRPYLVREVRGPEGTVTTEPEVTGRPISEATAKTMREMMKEVLVANELAKVPGYSAGGKSGTAYVPKTATDSRGNAYVDEVTIPSYAGFAPLNNPRIAILVKLDNLGTSDFGGTLTAPVFSRLAAGILTYLRVPPDQPETLPKTPTPAPVVQSTGSGR